MRPHIFTAAVLSLALAGCDSGSESTPTPTLANPFTCTDGALESVDLTVGTGETAAESNTVVVDYVGRLTNGTQFTQDTNGSYRLPDAIVGFRRGVAGMRVGGMRRITIPPNLGYGTGTPSNIPECSTLVFDVTLRDVQ